MSCNSQKNERVNKTMCRYLYVYQYQLLHVYSFARAALTTYFKLCDLHNKKLLSHSSRGQKLKIKVSPRLFPSEGCVAGQNCSMPLPSFCWLEDNLWCFSVCKNIAQIFAFSFTWCSPCVSLSRFQFLLFIRMLVILDQDPSNDLVLTLISSVETYFPK